MSEKVTFKYFEGRDVEQFTFYRIPKQLFTVSYFKGLSSSAKILYGLMLDRISLSVKNHWFDEQNRAYIYFSIEEVMELLGCGKNKAVKCMKELDEDTGIGLTQKRRQGFGKSNMIYVKTFLVEGQAEVKIGDSEKAGIDLDHNLSKETTTKQTTMEAKRGLTGAEEQTSLTGSESEDLEKTPGEKSIKTVETALCEQINQKKRRESTENEPDIGIAGDFAGSVEGTEKFNMETNGYNLPDIEFLEANFKKFTGQNSSIPIGKLLEVYKKDPNNTYYNKTEDSYNKSYLIVSGDMSSGADIQSDKKEIDAIRYDENIIFKRCREEGFQGKNEDLGAIYTLIRENIGLEDLLAAREMDKNLIMEIYSLIIEMASCKSKEVVIASSRYPVEIVRSRFLKLRYDHVIYVMDCLEKNTSKVNNIRKYLLAALFNAPATIDSYYRAEVRHDMVSAGW